MDRPFEKGATDDPSSRQGQVHGRGGERLRCRATVLKPGKTLIVAESEVYAVRDGKEKLAAKATVTLAPVGAGK
jgi:acyl-coenzyme A thioesterase PaaI-like protein